MNFFFDEFVRSTSRIVTAAVRRVTFRIKIVQSYCLP